MCVCVCVCFCTHRHSVSLEMLEGISVTSGGSWLQTDRVCSARTDSSAPGLTSVSVSGAEAAAIFIITITNIMRAIAVIVAVSHPQSRLLGFLTVQILSFVCVFLVCVYAHAGVPGESTQSVQLCAHRQVAESVRYWCASCRAVVNDGRVCGKSFMGVWGCRRSLLCVCVCVSKL